VGQPHHVQAFPPAHALHASSVSFVPCGLTGGRGLHLCAPPPKKATMAAMGGSHYGLIISPPRSPLGTSSPSIPTSPPAAASFLSSPRSVLSKSQPQPVVAVEEDNENENEKEEEEEEEGEHVHDEGGEDGSNFALAPEVQSVLRTPGLEKYRAVFVREEIDLESFLLLNDADLRHMNIPTGAPTTLRFSFFLSSLSFFIHFSNEKIKNK